MTAHDASLIKPADPLAALPLTIERRISTGTLVVLGAFIAVSAIVLLVPFAIVAVHAISHPSGVLATLSQPAAVLQLGLAFVVAFAFVIIPLRLLIHLATQPRRITIAGGHVMSGEGGQGEWSEPLTAYAGVAHHIRTSLSGARHEIVLVHAEPAKSVVLETADRIAQPRIDAVAAILNVAEVPARLMYERAAKQQLRSPKKISLDPVFEAA